MPQRCKICHHAKREEIEDLLLDGYPSLRDIGAQFGVSKDSLSRHTQSHMGEFVEEEDGLMEDEPRQTYGNSTPEKEKEIEISPVDALPGLESNEKIDWDELFPWQPRKTRTEQEEESRQVWALLDRLSQ